MSYALNGGNDTPQPQNQVDAPASSRKLAPDNQSTLIQEISAPVSGKSVLGQSIAESHAHDIQQIAILANMDFDESLFDLNLSDSDELDTCSKSMTGLPKRKDSLARTQGNARDCCPLMTTTEQFIPIDEDEDTSEELFGGVPDFLEMLRSTNDSEIHQHALRHFKVALEENPASLIQDCQALWTCVTNRLNSQCAAQALEVGQLLFSVFSHQLNPVVSQALPTLFGLMEDKELCAAAGDLLVLIAKTAPSGKVLTQFLGGTKSKCPGAKLKAAECLGLLIGQGKVNAHDYRAIVSGLAIMVRGKATRLDKSLTKVLKLIAVDDRYEANVSAIAKGSEEYEELMRFADWNDHSLTVKE
jgi:hypothetical protein